MLLACYWKCVGLPTKTQYYLHTNVTHIINNNTAVTYPLVGNI